MCAYVVMKEVLHHYITVCVKMRCAFQPGEIPTKLPPGPCVGYPRATMEPLPEELSAGAYGGSRLTSDLDTSLELAYDGRGDMATASVPEELPAEDARIIEAIAQETDWMTDVLTNLVRTPTTLGNEEAGQQIVREILRELGLDPVDVPMDAEALRAHPQAAPSTGTWTARRTWWPPGCRSRAGRDAR